MIFATMPPAPTRDQCVKEPGAVMASQGNWVEKLGGGRINGFDRQPEAVGRRQRRRR